MTIANSFPKILSAPAADRPFYVRLQVLYTTEDGGGYSAEVLNLPGCLSEGETLDEARDNIIEAATGLLESYRDSNQPVPWTRIQLEMTGKSEILSIPNV